MSTRFISDGELALCNENGAGFIETLIGFQAIVAVMTSDLGFAADGVTPVEVACVTLDSLDSVYGFTAEGTDGDLAQLSNLVESTPLTIYSPANDSDAAQLLAAILPSGELRSDIDFLDAESDLIANLSDSENPAVSYMTLSEYEALSGDDKAAITALEIRNGTTGQCYAPNLGNVEAGNYDAQRTLTLYASADSLENTNVVGLLTSMSNVESATAVAEEFNFTAGSESNYNRNQNNIADARTGRTFSRAASPVAISTAVEGNITISGSALSVDVVNAMTGNFQSQYLNATFNANLFGDAAAIEALCNGDAQAIVLSSEGDFAACDEAGIELYNAPIGAEALVFAVSAAHEDLPACVDLGIFATVFAAPIPAGDEIPDAEGRELPYGPQNWNEVDDYPDLPLHVFLPGRSTEETDWLFSAAGILNGYGRSDEEENVTYSQRGIADAGLFRAAAVANFEGGGVALLSWSDYQASEHQADLRLLEIDAGEGCVAPSEENFANGTYALANNYTLYLSRSAMGDEVVAAFMWSLLSEDSLTGLDVLNLTGTDLDDLRQRRDDVFVMLEEAIQAAAETEAETDEDVSTDSDEESDEATDESDDASSEDADEDTESNEDADADSDTEEEPTAEATEASE